jgi:predicted transposase YdaD
LNHDALFKMLFKRQAIFKGLFDANPFIELGKRQGRQEGIVEGRHEGQSELVLKQVARRIGAPSTAQEKSIRKLSAEKLEALGEALLDFAVPADLAKWLRQNK